MAAIVTSRPGGYGHGGPPVHPPWVHPSPEVRALEDLSIEVHEGETFGFLGPNGAGKSTTIRLLLGFLHPSAGSASVSRLDIVRQSVGIRARTGYLPGGIALYDTMSGEDLLDYLGDLTGRPATRRRELCDRLEMSEATLRRQVRDYSRGMRQKMGIIQSLQHDPELAILDEPSEGLDPLMQRAFYAILDDLRAAGRTIFFSSHVLSEVERLCDRVAIVRRGRLVALENVEALLARRSGTWRCGSTGPAVAGRRPGRFGCRSQGPTAWSRAISRAMSGRSRQRCDVRVVDLTIEPAHLEEAFLELYHDEEEELHEAAERPREPRPPVPHLGQPADQDPDRLHRADGLERAAADRLRRLADVPGHHRVGGSSRGADQFGGGDIFTLSGSIALGAIHPISLILNSVFAVGLATAAIAGERQRGTLEVLLARRSRAGRPTYVARGDADVRRGGVAGDDGRRRSGRRSPGVLDELLDRLPLSG